jgi:tRNA (guanine10-N2)-dimethyltransferase
MQSLLVLGRQPALGLAELESLYGAGKVQAIGSQTQAAIVDVDPCLLAFDRLGGSVKFCKLLTTLDTTNWGKVEKFLLQVSPGHAQTMLEGKMQLGLSLYGFNETPKRIEATGLSLKKAIRKTGRSVRLIPNKVAELNSAQVLHNHLTGPTGWELVFIRSGAQTIVAQTVKVQDIEAYAQRDRQRPKRDAKVGMLPPKLAQIIINLAAGKLPEDKLESICDVPAGQPIPRPLLGQTVLDPFCGTGVVLQEALLMSYDIYGSDLEPRMVDYTKQNIGWLTELYGLEATGYRLEAADATQASWSQPVDFVASETYLGRPFTARPTPEVLAQTVADCNLIIKKFLRNIHGQIQPGTRLCLAVPAWQTRTDQFKHLPLVDQIEDLGYNQVSFEHIRDEDLIYYRSEQIVARQLIVITRK